MDYTELFNSLYPGFFEEKSIRAMPKDWVFTELVMDLRGDLSNVTPHHCPNRITFDEYHGELAALRDAVAQVDEDWVQYFTEGCRHYCAFDGKRIIAFCNLADLGRVQGLHIGGPGCVGTIPEYREQGIGLEMVRLATEALRHDGFDLSWIHYTHLAHWYMKLGYQPILWWNSGGMLRNTEEDKMRIVSMNVTDPSVLQLFSEHDDYMIDFLGDDKWCYTRYSEKENIESVWVVYSDVIPIGCIAYRKKSEGVGEIKRLYIRSEYRRRGVSKKLLDTVECYAKEHGYHTLFLDTRITLEPAVSIYRDFGFSIVFQQGLYIQMEKHL